MIDEQELAANATEAKDFLQMVDGWVIPPDQLPAAGDLLRNVNTRLKDLIKRREAITKPMNDSLKSVRALFAPPVDALERAVDILKKSIAAANNKILVDNRIAMQEASRYLAANDAHGAAVATSTMTMKPTMEGVRTRETIQPYVENPDMVPSHYCSPDIYKIMSDPTFIVPRHLMSPDMNKIAAQLKVDGDKLNIPGVKVVINTQVIAQRI